MIFNTKHVAVEIQYKSSFMVKSREGNEKIIEDIYHIYIYFCK